LRDKGMRSRQTKETGFAFRSLRPCVTRHKRETKPQDGKLESVQGSPRQSGQRRSEPSRLSRAKVGYCRPQTRLAGMAAKWRQCEPRRHDDTKQVDKDSGLRGVAAESLELTAGSDQQTEAKPHISRPVSGAVRQPKPTKAA
jgi:hypothetical protein